MIKADILDRISHPTIRAVADQLAHCLAAKYAEESILTCSVVYDDGQRGIWRDLTGESQDLREELHYLEVTGKLIRHPSNPEWVRIVRTQ